MPNSVEQIASWRRSVFGGGTRVKLIEAMLNHIPIIASLAACAGLSVDHGAHVLLAETDVEFAASWDRLATTWSTDVRRMTEAAAEMAKENYTDAAMRADIAAVVQSIDKGRETVSYEQETRG